MADRLSLHAKLLNLCDNVYFQPPESVKLVYPCIVYKRGTGDMKYANDSTYKYTKAYELTVISKDPDLALIDTIAMSFPMIRHTNFYVVDNLNHDTYTLYY